MDVKLYRSKTDKIKIVLFSPTRWIFWWIERRVWQNDKNYTL